MRWWPPACGISLWRRAQTGATCRTSRCGCPTAPWPGSCDIPTMTRRMAAAALGPSEGSAPVWKVGPCLCPRCGFTRVCCEAPAPWVQIPPAAVGRCGEGAVLSGVSQQEILGAAAYYPVAPGRAHMPSVGVPIVKAVLRERRLLDAVSLGGLGTLGAFPGLSPVLEPQPHCSPLFQRAKPVTPRPDSSTPSFPGACPTLGTGTTTGLASTGGWSGMASSAQPSPTLSPWASR